jgi:hypothetical protein
MRQREPATRPATTSAAVTAPAPKAPTIRPAQVSGRPYACAKAGDNVFTGSEANPTIATINRNAASSGLCRRSWKLSRTRDSARLARSCVRGRTTTSATMKTPYDTALTANEAGIPR